MMTIFKYDGSRQDLIDATQFANEIQVDILHKLTTVYRDKQLINGSRKVVCTGYQLALELTRYLPLILMDIEEYYYKNSNVNGMYTASKPNSININTNSLPRDIDSLVATLWHELGHKIDTFSTLKLDHGTGWFRNRYYRWKENCMPFFLDMVAEECVRERVGDHTPVLQSGVNNKIEYVPWWKQIFFFWRY